MSWRRVVLRQADERMALAQGLVVGLALWGLVVNFVLHLVPGLAGAIVGWGVLLALGAVLTWRAPYPIGPRPRVAAGFVVAVLALFGVALASRQLISIPDPSINLGLAAFIRAGGFPPELPWNAGTLVRYHYGTNLLVGLLAPPTGRPDFPFAFELLGAYSLDGLCFGGCHRAAPAGVGIQRARHGPAHARQQPVVRLWRRKCAAGSRSVWTARGWPRRVARGYLLAVGRAVREGGVLGVAQHLETRIPAELRTGVRSAGARDAIRSMVDGRGRHARRQWLAF